MWYFIITLIRILTTKLGSKLGLEVTSGLALAPTLTLTPSNLELDQSGVSDSLRVNS